jgi:Peptidase family C25/Secretion system C-terminal sorting domain
MTLNKLKLFSISIIFLLFANLNLSAQLRYYDNQADYIIITHSQFAAALQPFVDWRQSKNLNVKVVELQQIYSEFADSTKSNSIRAFVSYALAYWDDPKPRYILLVGGTKLLPSYKLPSRFVNYANGKEDSVSIDELYSVNLYDSDTKPDICLGRFPVNNDEELNNVIAKTMNFEDSLTFKYYPTDFMILTDKTDSHMFERSANQFINRSIPLNFYEKTIFASEDSTIEITRKRLITGINDGTLFISYYGHGAPHVWSEYNILTLEDVDSLKRNNLPFIYTSAACSQSFDLPDDSSIVRKLIVSKRSGTVASINSTGLNYLGEGSYFLISFYAELFKNPDITLGDALLQAKLLRERNNDPMDSIPRRYTLLGDPALKLPFNTITQVAKEIDYIPSYYSLEQNYPNPFNPSTTIDYSIPTSGFVTINVYNVLGQEVASLVNEEKQAGVYQVNFNGIDLSSGVYIYKLQAGKFSSTQKMILAK